MNLLWNTHFIRPEWLYAFIPAAFLLFGLLRARFRQQSNWNSVVDPHLLPYLTKGQASKARWWPLPLITVALGLAIVAMAGPSWQARNIPVFSQKIGSVIVLDLSPNMFATDITPNRLKRARFKIRDLLAHPEGQIGLVVYSGEPYVVSPLTDTHNTIAAFLNDLTPAIMPIHGQAISPALKTAARLLKQAGNDKGHILLISSADKVSRDAIEMAKSLSGDDYDVSVLGLGTAKGAPLKLPDGDYMKNKQGNIIVGKLDVNGLKKLANAGNGRYLPFSAQNQDIAYFIKQLKASNAQTQQTKEKAQHIIRWQDQGCFFIWALLPLALLCFRRGWLECL